MKEKCKHGHNRRERTRALGAVNRALDAFDQSHRLARAGNLSAAERAVRLAERQAKLAAQLLDLKASLRRIALARIESERAVRAEADSRETALKQRQRELELAEIALEHRRRHAPPLDPEAERWKERLARVLNDL